MSAYGKYLPQYYEGFMGEERSILTPLKALLKKYAPFPKKILELGCGTGTILKNMPQKAELTGLDLSKDMLAIAQKKLPSATFVNADMTSFSLKKKFDLILCVFDTINHLNTFSLWKKTFKNVAQHLDKKGIFIMDMNSLERLAFATTYPSYARYVGKDTIIFKVNKIKSNLFDCHFQIFAHKGKQTYQLLEEHIYESGFPEENVTTALKKYFIIKKIYYHKQKKYPQSLRVFLVCQLK